MNKLKQNKLKILIFLACSILICSTLFFYDLCENWLNNLFFKNPVANLTDCDLTVHFVDIGQGDCILVDLPDDKIMIVDCGSSANQNKLEIYLNKFFEDKEKIVDYFVITHADEDHYGNGSYIFENYEVKNFYRPSVCTPNETSWEGATINDDIGYKKLIDESLKNEIGCQMFFNNASDDFLNQSEIDYNVRCFSPLEENYQNSNDYSAVLQIEYCGRKILLTGDAETNTEEKLINIYGEELKSDIIKVAHHGSQTSSSINFLREVSPLYAVISVEKGNMYNLPNEEIVARVKAFVGEENIYRTDEMGNVVFGLNSKQKVEEKASIFVKTTKATNVNVKVGWWCVIVLLEGLSFAVIFFVGRKKKEK